MHTFRGVLYIPTAWVSLCLFIYTGFLRALRVEQAEARYPAFFLCGSKHYFNSSEFGYLTGAKRVMMRDTILKIINEIRQTKGLVVLESIKDEQTLRNDLELTSFDLAELTVKIEDEYDIDIFEDGLVNTVGEIFAKLEK